MRRGRRIRIVASLALVVAGCDGSTSAPSVEPTDSTVAGPDAGLVLAGTDPEQRSDSTIEPSLCSSREGDEAAWTDEWFRVDRWIVVSGGHDVTAAVPGVDDRFRRVVIDDVDELPPVEEGGFFVVDRAGVEQEVVVRTGRRFAQFMAAHPDELLLGLGGDRLDFIQTIYAVTPDERLIKLRTCGSHAFWIDQLHAVAVERGFSGSELDLVAGQPAAVLAEMWSEIEPG